MFVWPTLQKNILPAIDFKNMYTAYLG